MQITPYGYLAFLIYLGIWNPIRIFQEDRLTPNVSVALAKGSHMAMPGVVMGGTHKDITIEGHVSLRGPKLNLPHTTKIIYVKLFIKIISELQRYNKGIYEIGIKMQDFGKNLKIKDELYDFEGHYFFIIYITFLLMNFA